jgi:cobaltochelatase CobT
MSSISRDVIAIAFMLLLLLSFIIRYLVYLLNDDSETKRVVGESKPTLQPYGGSGTKIGALTASVLQAPYHAYTTEFDVEISSERLTAEVKHFAPIWLPVLDEWRDATQTTRAPAELTIPKPRKASLLVTLLVDHSGSVRGDKARCMAAAVDSVALRLEDLKIKFEIVGFTTRSWRGGNSRKIWLADGKPQNPGRLCDLMYVLYKTSDQTYASQREYLGVMTVDDIHRENVDGEALLYTQARYQASGCKSWVCIVLSDGAPVDDSTLLSNKNKILDEHIRATIANLSADSDIVVAGLGIGHTVHGYYPVSESAEAPAEIASKLNALLELVLRQKIESPTKKVASLVASGSRTDKGARRANETPVDRNSLR